MTGVSSLALCSAIPLDDANGAPEWLHLLPSGAVRTADGRGPYRQIEPAQLMANSLKAGDKLVLDENHSTDLAAPKGGEAPARGWIVELQARETGIWGRVEWTPKGREVVANREYRGVSPVIAHLKNKTIVAIRRASLVNQPNLEGLVALHSEETGMDWKKMLVEALGLGESASDEEIAAALKKALAGESSEPADEAIKEAVQSALSPIATAIGLAADADGDAIVTGITGLRGDVGDNASNPVVLALQSELADVTKRLNAKEAADAKRDATAFVDSAIAAGRVGVKPMRDEYIAMHMENSARTEKLVNSFPALGGSLAMRDVKTSEGGLSSADQAVIQLMGVDPEKFKETRAAEAGEAQEAL